MSVTLGWVHFEKCIRGLLMFCAISFDGLAAYFWNPSYWVAPALALALAIVLAFSSTLVNVSTRPMSRRPTFSTASDFYWPMLMQPLSI
jgi:hypothetical protein